MDGPDLDVAELDETPATKTAAPAAGGGDADFEGGGETNFSDDSISQFDFEIFKGRKNSVDRIAIVNANNLRWHRVHYDSGKKGYVLCNSKYKRVGKGEVIDGKPALCCQKMDEPKKRFGAFVVQYGTTPDGKLVKPLTYTTRLWRFSESHFVQLRDINAEFPLDQHDLVIRCTDENFQKMTITAAKESVIRLEKFPEKDKKDIAEWVKAMLPKVNKSLGRKLTDAQLLERLGMATSARTVAQESVVGDIDDLLPTE